MVEELSCEKCMCIWHFRGLEKQGAFVRTSLGSSDMSCQPSLAVNSSKPLCNIVPFLPSQYFLLRNAGLEEVRRDASVFLSTHTRLECPKPGRGSAEDLGAKRKG